MKYFTKSATLLNVAYTQYYQNGEEPGSLMPILCLEAGIHYVYSNYGIITPHLAFTSLSTVTLFKSCGHTEHSVQSKLCHCGCSESELASPSNLVICDCSSPSSSNSSSSSSSSS